MGKGQKRYSEEFKTRNFKGKRINRIRKITIRKWTINNGEYTAKVFSLQEKSKIEISDIRRNRFPLKKMCTYVNKIIYKGFLLWKNLSTS